MKNLQEVSGLPIELNDDNTLKFNAPLEPVTPTARTYDAERPVLMSPDAQPPFKEMYLMYRNVHFKDDESKLKQSKVGYDITVIPPGKIGEEFNKTQGHYHATKVGTPFAYPEVYEVISGHALFLLQKMDPTYSEVITVIAMEAKAGDKVVYPPNYGHIIINIGDETLVTSNWVATDFERLYDQIIDKKGLAYYVVADGDGYKFVPNPNYKDVPKVRVITDKFMDSFSITKKGPMYGTGVNDPKSLEFLNSPEKYAVELSSITS